AMLDRVEILRSSRRAERVGKSIAGRRMADAGAGIHVVVAETATHQFLDQEGFLVGATRRRDSADGAAAVFFLNPLEIGRNARDRLVPCALAPRLGDLVRIIGL